MTVTVTAANGAVASYTVTVVVLALSSNNNLGTFTVNGSAVSDGSVVVLPKNTTGVSVVALAADAAATVAITGRSNLVEGDNSLVVRVTAANGSVQTFTVTLRVTPRSTDNSLATFTVNGSAVASGDVVTVANGTTSVTVAAVANDVLSVVDVAGRAGLVTGSNTLTVTVTAEDGTTASYSVTLFVTPLSTVKTLATFTINGSTVVSGAVVTLPKSTASAVVSAVASDANASVSVTGGRNLVEGNNTVTVVVTAEDGSTASYTVTLFVTPLSTNTALASLSVNGSTVAAGGVFVVPVRTQNVLVAAVAVDGFASVSITGGRNLVEGNNTVSVRVTAESNDGSCCQRFACANITARRDGRSQEPVRKRPYPAASLGGPKPSPRP